MIRRLALSVCLAGLLAGSALAHHNMSALFDFSQRFTTSGTLSKVDWRNPHIYLFVDVKNEKGRLKPGRSRGRRPASSGRATSGKPTSRLPWRSP